MELYLEKLIAHEAAYLQMIAHLEKTDCAWFLHGPHIPDYHEPNHALRLRDDGRGADAVAQTVFRYYRERGLEPIADVDAVAESQGIGAALRRQGITPVIGNWLLMRYAAEGLPELPERGVEVRVVPNETGAGEAEDWIKTVMSEEAEDDPYRAMWQAAAEHEARYPPCRLYLGLLEGKPVGACDLFSAEGWGRIDSVVTRPEFRRRGVASALVARAVKDSRTFGNEVTYLFTEAGGAGEQVYRRLGFVPWVLNVMRRHKT